MKAQEHLSKDAKLKKLILSIPPDSLHATGTKSDLREYLVGSIISQQLSVKVARVIQQRFLDLFGGRFPPNKVILKREDAELRAIGLSYQKLSYIKNIAAHFEEHKLDRHEWNLMDDADIIRELTKIKGVGQWTAEMVLMFGLCRPDVFSPGDYGIQMAMRKLYRLELEGKALQQKMLGIADKWKPYRTTACMYLWAWKDQ